MDRFLSRLIVGWQHKLIALLSAIIIWFLVSKAITTRVVVDNIPVRLMNIPAGMTVEGIRDDGTLKQRVTLTLTGKREILEHLEGGGFEVQIDATDRGTDWIAKIGRRNLVSTHPHIDLSRGVDSVSHSEFIIRLSPLVTAKILVHIDRPIGEPPKGYAFLDIWPQRFFHTVSGPEKLIESIKMKGLNLTFNLSNISQAELDEIAENSSGGVEDEVRYPVPRKWLSLNLPDLSDKPIQLQSPEIEKLHIDFLRRELLPVGRELPIDVFYSLTQSRIINPSTFRLLQGGPVQERHGIRTLNLPLYSRDVSRLFLDVVRDHLQVVVIAKPNIEKNFEWEVQFIGLEELESRYVEEQAPQEQDILGDRSPYLRQRFRAYMRGFALYKADGSKLELTGTPSEGGILIEDVTGSE